MTITLKTFIPGTKAKADDVNSNFTALKDALDEKAAVDGDGTQTFAVAPATKDSHAVNKSQLTTLSDNLSAELGKTGVKFCAKSGNTTNGAADLFSVSSSYKLVPKIAGSYNNLVISDYLGVQTTISSVPDSLNLSGNSDATYNIFITPSGTLYVLNNTIYRQANRPTMVVGDVWLNTSCEPFKCIKYSGSSDAVFTDVPLGRLVLAGNVITYIETFSFNQNSYSINSQTNIATNTPLAISIPFCMMPNYQYPSGRALSTVYQAQNNGFLHTIARFSGTLYTSWGNPDADGRYSWTALFVNAFGDQGYTTAAFFPIAKGMFYKYVANSSGSSMTFYPCISS